jgi:hypothetical protein
VTLVFPASTMRTAPDLAPCAFDRNVHRLEDPEQRALKSNSNANEGSASWSTSAVQVFFCKFREGDFSVVVITLSG